MFEQVIRRAHAGPASRDAAAQNFEPMDERLTRLLVAEPLDGVPSDRGGFIETTGILGEQHLFVAGQRRIIQSPVGGMQFVRRQAD